VSDATEPPVKTSRLIVPGADPEPSVKSRIILPPGSSFEAHDELPEYPRLRAVQFSPVRDGERELLVISDPLGITPGTYRHSSSGLRHVQRQLDPAGRDSAALQFLNSELK